MAQKGQLTTADYLPVEEYKKLVEGLHNDGLYLWETFCRVAFSGAFRCSDVQRLTWNEVLGMKDLVRTEIKTEKTREIYFNRNVQAKMKQLYELQGNPDKTLSVVANPQTGEPYHINWINTQLKTFRVKYRISIKRFSTHTFRKTFGRWVYDNAENKSEALVMLNIIFKHSSIEITKRYIGITQDEIKQVFYAINF